MRIWGLSALALACVAAHAAPTTFVEGDLRIQFLSPTLVRIEQKGPKGFEDRKTFTVVERDWSGSKATRSTSNGMVILRSGDLVVHVPSGATTLQGVAVFGVTGPQKGAVLTKAIFTGGPKPPANTFFPAPGRVNSYVVSDSPRLIPAPWGAVPAPAGNKLFPETSGWDTGNNADDVYVFYNPNYSKLRSEFLRLTGPTELPPYYIFGFIDSRWYKYTEQSALASIDEYRKRGIPLDGFVCDTDWRVNGSDGYKIATDLFPDMGRFIKEAHKRNVRLMFNDHPNPITDALSEEELKTRWDGLSSLLKLGMDVWWYDRNWHTHLKEPMPGIRPEVWGQALYRDITLANRPTERPLIMTNVQGIDNGMWNYAPHPASHRYPIQWTGDTQSTWAFLERCVENGVRSGVERLHAYVNDDLGGHAGTPSPELYTRFLQYGCLSPITRVHCTYNLLRHPWDFGADAEKTVSDYIKLRYRLLPTIYSAARRNFEDGTPILRRCDLEWPSFPQAADDTQYLLGDDVLVAPIIESMTPLAKPVPASLFMGGLKGEYFNNKDLSGEPKFVKTDANVDFDWGGRGPQGMPNDNFSVRWTGKLGPIPSTGDYNLQINVDDGARLWIDGQLVIDNWKPTDNGIFEKKIHFEQGSTHDVKIEYYEEGGQAKVKFGWTKVLGQEIRESKRSVWIPPGEWQNLWTGARVIGPKVVTAKATLQQMPMWVRCGGVVFTGPTLQYTGQKPLDRVTLNVVIPSKDGVFLRTLYQDDGHTNTYKSGQYAKTPVRLTRKDGRVTVEILPTQGPLKKLAPKTWGIRIYAPSSWPNVSTTANGKSLRSIKPEGKVQVIPFPVTGAEVSTTRRDPSKTVRLEFKSVRSTSK